MTQVSLQRDQNHVPVLGGVYDDGSNTIAPLAINSTNGRLKVTAIIASGGSGVLSINGDTTAAQLITSGTAGTDVAVSTASGTTTINIPSASAANRGALISADWTTFNNKQVALVSGTNIKTVNSTTLLGAGDLAVGTVTAIGVTTANGVSGSSSGGTTPNLTITLGAITPTTVNALTLTSQAVGFTIAGGTISKTLTVPLDASVSGTNTGDQNLFSSIPVATQTTVTANSTTTALTFAAGSGMSITTDNGTKTITFTSTTTGGITWSAITADQTATVNNGYLANKGTLLTLTLPTTSAVGTTVRIAGMNAGLWKVAQAAGQYIKYGNQATTVGVTGSLASVLTYDAVEIICIVADTGWVVTSSIGNITVA